MQIRFLGHATFELSEGSTPRAGSTPSSAPNNPKAPVRRRRRRADPRAADPWPTWTTVADAVAVAKRTGAHCVALVELAGWLGDQGVENVSDPNIGGTVEFDWGWVRLVQAWHSSTTPDGKSAGAPTGLVVNIGGTTVYHLGDTGLFSDLKLIAERTPVDVAIIPIGGHYTMDRHDAFVAAKLIGAGTVIPRHYDTFPPIENGRRGVQDRRRVRDELQGRDPGAR